MHGHTLVVPKKEIDYFFDLEAEALSSILQFAQPIAKAIQETFPCKRCGIAVIGLEVPHAHLHIVPINSAEDLNFTRPKLKPTPEELLDAQTRILEKLMLKS